MSRYGVTSDLLAHYETTTDLQLFATVTLKSLKITPAATPLFIRTKQVSIKM
jgi:hypothetical protein